LSVDSAITLHAGAQRRLHHVLGAVDVGEHAFERVVLGGRHDLQRGGVHDDVDAAHRQLQPADVAHVADEVAHGFGVRQAGELALHVVLLLLVAREHDELARLGAGQRAPRTKARPNEPVPPVMSTDLPARSTSGCSKRRMTEGCIWDPGMGPEAFGHATAVRVKRLRSARRALFGVAPGTSPARCGRLRPRRRSAPAG
jgi:hypothetical protein